MLQHTVHSALRSAQRGLTDDEIDYVFHYGSRHHSDGAIVYYLRRKDLPGNDLRKDWAAQLIGTALIVDLTGNILLTTWRNRRKGLKLIRKKSAI